MKPFSLILCCLAALALAGCSSSVPTSLFGSKGLASIGGGAVTDEKVETLAANSSPVTTGSLPGTQLPAEAVETQQEVGTPTAYDSATNTLTEQDTQLMDADEEDLSADERHRRELINRGDLEPGQPLPAE